jgi:hypothetical protein
MNLMYPQAIYFREYIEILSLGKEITERIVIAFIFDLKLLQLVVYQSHTQNHL